ncbi:MAG: HemK2/MTQ2 family protein methyltransferase [Candidatus Micrarchaeota archaeon]
MSFESRGHSLLLRVPSSVYAPSDDSALLASVALDACFGDVLEVGCGSGVVGILLALEGKCDSLTLLDINPQAVACAKENARKNKIGAKIKFICSDLFVRLPASSHFDFILFNPPYLPTMQDEKLPGRINRAFDGGKDGLEAVAGFLARVKKHLAPGGKILLVASSLQPKEKLDKLIEKTDFAPARWPRSVFSSSGCKCWN